MLLQLRLLLQMNRKPLENSKAGRDARLWVDDAHRGKGQKYLFQVIAITGEQWQVPANSDDIVC